MSEKEKLQLFKEKLIETMKAFDAFCREFDIKYVAAYGTAIGAIRHNGLIPWDNDIDVFMDCENYKRFLELKDIVKTRGYGIVDRHEGNYQLPFAKFINNSTTIWERINQPCIYGVYIDVFVLGYANDAEKAREMHSKYLKLVKSLAYARQGFSFTKKDVLYILKHLTKVIKGLCKRGKLNCYQTEMDKLDEEIANIKDGKYRLDYRSRDGFKNSLFEAEWFKDTVYVKFEDMEMPMPAEYDKYLTTLFGDYMTPPPAEQQIPRHCFYYINLKEGLSMEEVKARLKRGESEVY